MGALYALLVGIDTYRPPFQPLRGCRNDIRQAEATLRAHHRPGSGWEPLVLLDDQATREAVIAGFEKHLGRAGGGDTALFWFSGHGSQAPVPTGLEWLEPNGMLQSIVCADSRVGDLPDLLDKEIALMLAEVARRGAHVAVILDCCYSDGATREKPGSPSIRWLPPMTAPPLAGKLLPGLLAPPNAVRGATPTHAAASHVLLAACDVNQTAREVPRPGGDRGVFSAAILDQLTRLGPAPTYRELMVAVRCQVENTVRRQRPTLSPSTESIVDRPFLGGELRTSLAGITMRYLRGAWEINAGECHGLTAGEPDYPTEVGTADSEPVRRARVTAVLADRSNVEPIDWTPDRARQYPMVLTSVPLPAVTITIDPRHGNTAARIATAVDNAAPGGRPSPHLRIVDSDDPARLPDLRVVEAGTGTVEVLSADYAPIIPAAKVESPESVASLVADLEHIACWRQIKALENPASTLAGAIQLEVLSANADHSIGPPLVPDANGALNVEYRQGPHGWIPPEIFVRLRNNHNHELYCVLLNLTDRFRVHAKLFPGDWVAPGYTAWTARGKTITLSLPPGRSLQPGARGHDWLKFLVSEQPFSAEPFQLPRLGEPAIASERRSALTLTSVIDRLGFAMVYRRAAKRVPLACDWTTGIAPIVTRIPSRGIY